MTVLIVFFGVGSAILSVLLYREKAKNKKPINNTINGNTSIVDDSARSEF